jgi:hypothetical protein
MPRLINSLTIAAALVLVGTSWAQAATTKQLNREELARVQASGTTAASPTYPVSPAYPGPALGGHGGHGGTPNVMTPPSAAANAPSSAYPGPALGGHGGHGVQPAVIR